MMSIPIKQGGDSRPIITVSKALFYTSSDTLFQDPFWGVSDFPVSYHGYYTFLSFLCGFLIAGVRKTQEDTLKVFIYQKYLGMQNNNTGGDRMLNTDRHKIYTNSSGD